MSHPTSRRARVLRALGVTLVILAAIVAAPLLLAKLFADAKGTR